MTEQGKINLSNDCKELFKSGDLTRGVRFLNQFNRVDPKSASDVIDWANARGYISDDVANSVSKGTFSLDLNSSRKRLVEATAPSGDHEFPHNEPYRNDEGFEL